MNRISLDNTFGLLWHLYNCIMINIDQINIFTSVLDFVIFVIKSNKSFYRQNVQIVTLVSQRFWRPVYMVRLRLRFIHCNEWAVWCLMPLSQSHCVNTYLECHTNQLVATENSELQSHIMNRPLVLLIFKKLKSPEFSWLKSYVLPMKDIYNSNRKSNKILKNRFKMVLFQTECCHFCLFKLEIWEPLWVKSIWLISVTAQKLT